MTAAVIKLRCPAVGMASNESSKSWSDKKSAVLVVGHEPFLSRLNRWLLRMDYDLGELDERILEQFQKERGMFLRRNRRQHRGELYEYWTLVECVRTARGPRQRVVATLGKLPSLDQEEQRGWEEIERLVEGRQSGRQTEFFEPSSPELSSAPQWAQVDLRALRVERVREFGNVYLGLSLWRRLGLH